MALQARRTTTVEVEDPADLEVAVRDHGSAKLLVPKEEVDAVRDQIAELLSGTDMRFRVGKENRGVVPIVVTLKDAA